MLVVFGPPRAWEEVYGFSNGTVQPIVKSLDEMLRELREGNSFFVEALEDGVPLWDAAGTYERLKDEAEEAKARFGLVREEDGWRRSKP